MRKILTVLSLLLITLSAMAVPAKKGIWKSLPLNGEMVRAQLIGDEHVHYWQTEDGLQLAEQNGLFVTANVEQMRKLACERRAMLAEHKLARVKRKGIGDFMHYTGQKKGLIILVEFSNMQFKPENDSLRYTRICNEPGYNEGSFRGSVYDYFRDQSYGEFELTFDVMGPVQMDSIYQYYGHDLNPADSGSDSHPGEMTAKACMAVDDLVDFADYDWDGDGYVDQVMCIYAGTGQASGGGADTIWPHEWNLEESDFGQVLELDGVKINTYACANEREGNSISGIGTICHEFSHCLGLPDMYDINYGGNFGMGDWSLMDGGSYNGNSFCPAGYSSFDKLTCGWVNPVELIANQQIDSMKPLAQSPEVYMVRNDGYDDEYYLLENRQRVGWDAELPGNGMLIIHVDFDREIWMYNLVNTKSNGGGGFPANDHQRCTIFHADNYNGSGMWHNSSTDPYPYQENDSLTNTSMPAARLYNYNVDGSLLMNKGIMDITRNSGGTMSFRFRNSPEEIYLPAGTIFYESFNQCNGIGGNDGTWNTMMASSIFVADNDDWIVQKPYGGFKCARFGNGSTAGKAVTPMINMETDRAELSFLAAGWNKDGTTLTLSVEGEGEVEPATVTMENFVWNEYKVTLKGTGQMRVVFTPEKRFLLDEVLVVALSSDTTIVNPDTTIVIPDTTIVNPDTTVVTTITSHRSLTSHRAGYYTLDGRFAGTTLEPLPYGMYILYSAEDRKGRKIVK